MEKFSEVYNNIKDRLSNPFIFSFLCSWLVYNWRIPIALIRYDKSQFNACGCQTIFDFISYQYYHTEGSIRFPIMFAILYSFFNPIIKNLVKAYNTWSSKWGGLWILGISEGSKIPIEKYLKLVQKYDKKTKKIEKLALEEDQNLDKIEKLIDELNTANTNLNEVTDEKNKMLISITDIKILNGVWKFTKKDFNITGSQGEQISIIEPIEITIKDGAYYEGIEQKYVITDFFYHPTYKTIIFNKVLMENNSDVKYFYQARNFINRLNFSDTDKDSLVGIENGVPVEYYRIKNQLAQI